MYIARFMPCGCADLLFVVMKVKGKLLTVLKFSATLFLTFCVLGILYW